MPARGRRPRGGSRGAAARLRASRRRIPPPAKAPPSPLRARGRRPRGRTSAHRSAACPWPPVAQPPGGSPPHHERDLPDIPRRSPAATSPGCGSVPRWEEIRPKEVRSARLGRSWPAARRAGPRRPLCRLRAEDLAADRARRRRGRGGRLHRRRRGHGLRRPAGRLDRAGRLGRRPGQAAVEHAAAGLRDRARPARPGSDRPRRRRGARDPVHGHAPRRSDARVRRPRHRRPRRVGAAAAAAVHHRAGGPGRRQADAGGLGPGERRDRRRRPRGVRLQHAEPDRRAGPGTPKSTRRRRSSPRSAPRPGRSSPAPSATAAPTAASSRP